MLDMTVSELRTTTFYTTVILVSLGTLCAGRLATVASFAPVHPIRDNLPGNDLNCGTWDHEYNQQLRLSE